jgi:hypothetical protein
MRTTGTAFWTVVIGATIILGVVLATLLVLLSANPTTPRVHQQTTTTVTQTTPTPAAPATPAASSTPTWRAVWTGSTGSLMATASASDKFTNTVFWTAWYDWYHGWWSLDGPYTDQVWSPVMHQYYSVTMTLNSQTQRISAVNNSDPTCRASFPYAMMQAYTVAQANAYATPQNIGPGLK